MAITLSFFPGAEARLQAAAAARGREVADLVYELIEQYYGDQPCDKLTPAERIAALKELIAKHAVHDVVVDDSREGIYRDEE
jgi:hypothetical protein